jgi:hypothetical protein
MKQLAVVAADTHLRPYTWVAHPGIAGDAYDSWHQLVEYACFYRLPLILLGDIFDSPTPDPLSVEHWLDGLDKLAEHNLKLFYVQGNHEGVPNGMPAWASLSRAKNAVSLHNKVIMFDGVPITGMDFQRSNTIAEVAAGLPDAEICCVHQAWAEVQRVGSTHGSIANLLGKFKLVMTGDYHVRLNTQVPAGRNQVRIHSPGSTALQSLAESDDKFATLLGFRDGELVLEDLALKTRDLYKFEIGTEEDIDRIAAVTLVRTCDKMPIVKIKYAASIPKAAERLGAAFSARSHLFLEAVTQTHVQYVSTGGPVRITIPVAIERLASSPETAELTKQIVDCPQNQLQAFLKKAVAVDATNPS